MNDNETIEVQGVQPFLADKIAAAVRSVLPEGEQAPRLSIDRSKAGFASDYQSAVAMQLAKVLRRAPRDIGALLATEVDAQADPRLEAVEVSGPGFLGLRLSEGYLGELLHSTLASERLAVPYRRDSVVVIDYSSPNVA